MTKYAMGVLKSSVHNCFFCYELRRASLEEEISFLERRLGPNRTLIQLLALRREYRNSFRFVVCLHPDSGAAPLADSHRQPVSARSLA